MEEPIKTLDERVYDLHGTVSSLDATVKDLAYDLKTHILWAEDLVKEAKKDERTIIDKLNSFERRVDKIELKVAFGVSVFLFALNHIGWAFDQVKNIAMVVTAVANAMGN